MNLHLQPLQPSNLSWPISRPLALAIEHSSYLACAGLLGLAGLAALGFVWAGWALGVYLVGTFVWRLWTLVVNTVSDFDLPKAIRREEIQIITFALVVFCVCMGWWLLAGVAVGNVVLAFFTQK